MARKRALAVRQRFCRHGTDFGVGHTWHLRAARLHHERTFAVVVFFGIDASHQSEVMHLLGGFRQ